MQRNVMHNSSLNHRYLDYFYSRGLSNKTITDFNLGFCDDTGRCFHPEYTPLTDFRFHDSVLFPVKDLYNNLIAVASRSVATKNYIHSKYSKKRHLFGLNVTHKEILNTKKAFVVEGNFDLLTLYEHGITNVVAMLGSKLSLTQISLLTRFADEIIIATDGDTPGQVCAFKLAKTLDDHNISHRLLTLPQDADPDSFIRANGADAFLKLVSPDLLTRTKNL